MLKWYRALDKDHKGDVWIGVFTVVAALFVIVAVPLVS